MSIRDFTELLKSQCVVWVEVSRCSAEVLPLSSNNIKLPVLNLSGEHMSPMRIIDGRGYADDHWEI